MKESSRATEPDEFEKELRLLTLVLNRVPEEERSNAARRVCAEAAVTAGNNLSEMVGILETAKLEVWQMAAEGDEPARDDEDEWE
jgi:hypothetical protein